MRKTLIVLPLLSLPLLSMGQETEKRVVDTANPPTREVYFVQKSAPTVRQGMYQRYAGENFKTLMSQGYYANGRKDSVWAEYGTGSKKPLAQGRYRLGQKTGVWTYTTFAGKPALKYDFSSGKIVEGQALPLTGISFRALAGEPALETNPQFPEGGMGVMTHLAKNIRYPSQALRNMVMGKVTVAFTIDANGEASDFRVVKGIGFGCDEEALRVVKLLPPGWLPAQAGGKAVAAECELPVTFSIR